MADHLLDFLTTTTTSGGWPNSLTTTTTTGDWPNSLTSWHFPHNSPFNWEQYLSPPLDLDQVGVVGLTLECGGRYHTIMIGRELKLILRDHDRADVKRQLVLGALSGTPCPCVHTLMKWRLSITENCDHLWPDTFRPFLLEAKRRRNARMMKRSGWPDAFTHKSLTRSAAYDRLEYLDKWNHITSKHA